MIDIKGKTILVTGAARGIGKLMTIELSKYGVNLILVSRDKAHTAEVEEIVRSNGSTAVSFGCDLGSREDVEKLIKDLSSYSIDIIYNNAGDLQTGRFRYNMGRLRKVIPRKHHRTNDDLLFNPSFNAREGVRKDRQYNIRNLQRA